jgi:hypothetical protein
MRRRRFDRAFRILAGTLLVELLWISWLKAETPCERRGPRQALTDREAIGESGPGAPGPPALRPRPWRSESAASGPAAHSDEDPGADAIRGWFDPAADEEDIELMTLGGGGEAPDPAEEERRLHPPPPCEIEVLDADGEPMADCVTVALGDADRPLGLTWTNAAGVARLASTGATADLLIDVGSMVHRERGVPLSAGRFSVVMTRGVEISGRASIDGVLASQGDGLEVEF